MGVGRRAWPVAGLLAVLVVVQYLLLSDRPSPIELIVLTAVPVGVLAISLASATDQRRWILVGALLLAVTPTALSALASAGWQGAYAVLLACAAPAVDRLPGRVEALGAAIAVMIGFTLWASASPGHGELPAPSWGEVVTGTGDLVRTSVGAVGELGAPLPATPMLGWWVAVGLVIGTALLAGAWKRALVIPAAVGLLVVGAWAVARWRGPVPVGGGTWILSAAVAYTGATRLAEPAAERRIGRCLIVAAAWIWCTVVAQQIRSVRADAGSDWAIWDGWTLTTTSVSPIALLVAGVAAVAALAAVLWVSAVRSVP